MSREISKEIVPTPRPVPRREGAPTPEQAAAMLLWRTKLRPTLALVLGSGFQPVVKRCTVVLEVPYSMIPGFLQPGVDGHEGKLILGYLDRTPVVVMSGRFHYYEGHSLEAITFPIRMLHALGIKALLLTNAAGAVNTSYRPGDFMCLSDHMNFIGMNPLRGPAAPGRKRFVDLTETYHRSLRKLMKEAARENDVRLHEGVYLAVSGPSYETPAEVRAFGILGADAVGMSTVPEAIVARQCDMKVVAVSCLTNMAAGRGNSLVGHEEVLEVGRKASQKSSALLETFARLYAQK